MTQFTDWLRDNKKTTMMVVFGIIAVVVALVFAFSTPIVGDAAGTSLALKLLIVAIGFSCWFVFLRLSDAFSCIDFRTSFDLIEGNAMAAAVYFGLRLIGVGLFLGSVLG